MLLWCKYTCWLVFNDTYAILARNIFTWRSGSRHAKCSAEDLWWIIHELKLLQLWSNNFYSHQWPVQCSYQCACSIRGRIRSSLGIDLPYIHDWSIRQVSAYGPRILTHTTWSDRGVRLHVWMHLKVDLVPEIAFIITAWSTKVLSACCQPVTKGHNWHVYLFPSYTLLSWVSGMYLKADMPI